MTRSLFTDGVNSVAHVAFGVLAVLAGERLLVTVAFVGYQLMSPDDPNLVVDICEYAAGYVAAAFCCRRRLCRKFEIKQLKTIG